LIGAGEYGAEQLAGVPPLLPAQDQFHGPVPVTADAVPRLQSPVVGALVTATPLAVPHEPFTVEEATGAEQLAVVRRPRQLQYHGPLPLTAEAIPALQRLVVGALLAGTPFAEPQTPYRPPCCCANAGVARNETQNATRKIVLIIVLLTFRALCGATRYS
jgi:hypothetical protein